MIVQETLDNGLIRTYSDKGKRLIQKETGAIYDEAIDLPLKFTYEESKEDIEKGERENETTS